MGEDFCYLLTLLNGDTLLRCAIKTPCKLENFDREEIAAMLPPHVRSCGPILDMEPIFEVVINDSPNAALTGGKAVPSNGVVGG